MIYNPVKRNYCIYLVTQFADVDRGNGLGWNGLLMTSSNTPIFTNLMTGQIVCSIMAIWTRKAHSKGKFTGHFFFKS